MVNNLETSISLKRAISDTDEEPYVKSKRLNLSSLDRTLECPICYDFPREIPIYSCQNGHVVCNECLSKTKKMSCPVCRNTNTRCRNLVAEQILMDREMNCKNADNGCKFASLLPDLVEHEKVCLLRTLPCPGGHRMACKWEGPLRQMVKHLCMEKCAIILKLRPNQNEFVSVIGDFSDETATIFGNGNKTYWKPVILVSMEYFKIFPYLTVHRSKDGIWTLCVRSFNCTEQITERYGFKLIVREPRVLEGGPTTSKSNSSWSMTGNFLPNALKENEVTSSGSHLQLTDSQVKTLTVGKTLFEYSVEIFERTQVDGSINAKL